MALFLLKNYLKVDSKTERRYRQIARNLGIKKLKRVNSKDWDSKINSAWTNSHTTALSQINNAKVEDLVSFTGKQLKDSAKTHIGRLTTIKNEPLKVSDLSDNTLLTTAFEEPESTEAGRSELKMTDEEFKKYIDDMVPKVKETEPVISGMTEYEKDKNGKRLKDKSGKYVFVSGSGSKEITKTTKTFRFSETTSTSEGKLALLISKKVKGLSLVSAGGSQSQETGETASVASSNRMQSSRDGKVDVTTISWDNEPNAKDGKFTNKQRMDFLRGQSKSIRVAKKLINQHIKANKSPSEKILQFLSRKGTERLAPKLQSIRNPLELKERLMGLEFLFDKKSPKSEPKEGEEEPVMLDTINESFDKLSEQYKEYNKFRNSNITNKVNLKRVILNMNTLLGNIRKNINKYGETILGELDSLEEVRESEKPDSKSTPTVKETTAGEAEKAYNNFNEWFSNKDGHFYHKLTNTHSLFSFVFKITKKVTREMNEDDEIETKTSYEFNQWKESETHEISRGSVDTRVKSLGMVDGAHSKFRRRTTSSPPLYSLSNTEKQGLSYFVNTLTSGMEKLENRLNN